MLTLAGLLFIDAWGALRHASNVAFVCLEASMIESSSIDTNKFQQMALDQIHYTLGIKYKNNIVSQSFSICMILSVSSLPIMAEGPCFNLPKLGNFKNKLVYLLVVSVLGDIGLRD